MRHIKKQRAPKEYVTWFNGRPVIGGERQDCSYEWLRREKTVIEAVKNGLVMEQRYLCCYTGLRIDDDAFHVEHLKPQSLCINNEDVAYENLMAAHPAPNKGFCPFGAHAKDDWYDSDLFISPLDPFCAERFRYLRDGMVEPADPSDIRAKETINVLQLNHSILVKQRKQVIETFKALVREEKLGQKKIKEIADGSSDSKKLPEFYFVIQQLAPLELKRKQAMSRDRRSINSKRKRRK